MKKLLILFAVMLITIPALSQERSKFLYVQFADKSITTTPFYKAFGNNFDPAVTLGWGIEYSKKGNSVLFQTVEINGYRTEYVIQGASLISSFGYGYHHGSGIFGETSLGIGAGGFTLTRETFTLNDEDVYTASKPLNFAASIPFDLRLGYDAGRISIYLSYRYVLMGPYADNLPLLPLSLTGVGLRYDLKTGK